MATKKPGPDEFPSTHGFALILALLLGAAREPDAPIARPQIYPRCGGENISPQLAWSGAPAGTKSFVLTMIDISVKPAQWSHWIVVGLPRDTTSLARGAKILPGAATAVPSNFGDARYDGPCPPNGTGVHNYQLTIWALRCRQSPLRLTRRQQIWRPR